MAPMCRSGDVGSFNTPKRSRKVLPLSEKAKVLNLIRKGIKSYAEVAKIYGKNEPCLYERKKKDLC